MHEVNLNKGTLSSNTEDWTTTNRKRRHGKDMTTIHGVKLRKISTPAVDASQHWPRRHAEMEETHSDTTAKNAASLTKTSSIANSSHERTDHTGAPSTLAHQTMAPSLDLVGYSSEDD